MSTFDLRLEYLRTRSKEMAEFTDRIASILSMHGDPIGEQREKLENHLDNWTRLIVVVVHDRIHGGAVDYEFYDVDRFVSYDACVRNLSTGDAETFWSPVVYNMKTGTRWETMVSYRTLPNSVPSPDGVWS